NARDLSKFIIPAPQGHFEWCFANSTDLQSALQNFSRQITYHLPSHRLLKLSGTTAPSLKPLNSCTPLKGVKVLTNDSGEIRKVITWKEESGWQTLEDCESGSPQLVEPHAVAIAFQRFPHIPLNIETDSAYIADITQRLDRALLREIDNAPLFDLLKTLWHTIQARTCKTLWHTIQARTCPYYILYIRSHTNLPDFIAEGNARADWLASPAWTAPQPDMLAQAKTSHAFFHQ
ncbi:POK19 protein, partial [Oxylabes madagascariensis]|nr:POK19 protein [Oxylabes madagascariensis]